VILYANLHGVLHALWDVVVWILVVAAEFLVTALVVAPRAVSRKLLSLVRALVSRTRRTLRDLLPRRGPAHPSP
jgi:hypothetical protein